MTTPEFDASTSSPRRGFSVAECGSVSSSPSGDRTSQAPTEFLVSIADVTDEEHQNTPGLVDADDFNADVVVRFLRENGIDAYVDESTGGFRFRVDDPGRESHVRFACVCLRASISYAIEAAFWVHQGEAMMSTQRAPSCRKHCNGHHPRPPVELLSARAFRLRIARGYSIDDLAMAANVFGGTIHRLESGKPIDKRELPRLAAALGVPLCRLACGENGCTGACVTPKNLVVTCEPYNTRHL